jgi:acetyl esterase/lipase
MMDGEMHGFFRLSLICMAMTCAAWTGVARGASARTRAPQLPPQDTGFLNRTVTVRSITYRFEVYLPEQWRRDDSKRWPVILFLHGRGERGSEGLWQTQIGLPEAVRNHPDRWPFVIVMPQCPQTAYWTDPAMLELAMAALHQESAEFHGDPARTYLTGLSMGGYGAWELALRDPQRWAAIAIAAGGVFWSYEPERWQAAATLPAKYARAVVHTPLWLFHGTSDEVVAPRQSELMFDAVKAAGGNIRLWTYQGLQHDCWTRAFDEPELPRWLLEHHTPLSPVAMAERVMIPLRPPAVKLTAAQLDSMTGIYREPGGKAVETIVRQGDQLFEKSPGNEMTGLEEETADTFLRPVDVAGAHNIRLTFEHDAQGRVTGFLLRDNRREERWIRQNGR